MNKLPGESQKQHWFKAKKYGYGWGLPITWQGWVTMIVFLIVYLGPLLWIFNQPESEQDSYVIYYLAWAFITVVVLLKVVSAHGPKARWRWGDKTKGEDGEQ